jgi:hypothetical protein
VRDNNWKTLQNTSNPSLGYKDGFDDPFPDHPMRNYCLDVAGARVDSFPQCDADNRYIVPNVNTGVYAVGNSGKFRRIVTSRPFGPGNVNRRVTSTVTWNVRGTNHTVTLADVLTPWGDK